MTLLNIVTDAATDAVLALNDHTSAILFVHKAMDNTGYATEVNRPHYLKSLFLLDVPPADLPRWKWNFTTRHFEETPVQRVTPELLSRSQLAMAKVLAISTVIKRIISARYCLRTGIDFQETVYMTKKLQAQQFKDSGYDDSRMLEFPYIVQYADFAKISLKQATDDILLKSKMADDVLARTELLRLTYSNKIKIAKTVDEIQDIITELNFDTRIMTA